MGTVIYLLQHNKTGMKYLGKTSNPQKLGRPYLGSGDYWISHRAKHGWRDVSILSVSEEFTDPDELREFALFLSEELDIVENPEFANLKEEDGGDGGTLTEETRRKISENTDYVQAGKSISKTMNDPEWKNTIGKQAVKKRLENQDFVATGKKVSATKRDPHWIQTVGKSAREKQVKNTNYKETNRKSADTRLTDEWKNNNKYSCPDCGKSIHGAGNFKQHRRGSKCHQKEKKE